MMFGKLSVLMALLLAMSCYAQDSAVSDGDSDNMATGDPISDAIAELVCIALIILIILMNETDMCLVVLSL